jgi:hypothetical protein
MRRVAHGAIGPFLAIALGCLVLSVPSPVAACVGGRLFTEGDARSNAEAIFTGTLVRREDSFQEIDGYQIEAYLWTFVVDHVEKGEGGTRVTVWSPRAGASCGVALSLGTRYRVLAYHGQNREHLEVTSGDVIEAAPLADPPRIEGQFGLSIAAMLIGLSLDPISLAMVVAICVILISLVYFIGSRRLRRVGRQVP